MQRLERMIKRQQVLADFGEFALRSGSLDEVLTEACRLVAEALGTDHAKVLEIQDGGDELLLRAGVGWAAGLVGTVRLKMTERSSESYSIRKAVPVVTHDIREEARFDVPEFMRQAGVIALVNVPIFVHGPRAYGLLQVDALERREFGQDEIEFLRTYSAIVGPVIDRLRKLDDLRDSEERFRQFGDASQDILWIRDARSLQWIYLTPAFEKIYGLSREKALAGDNFKGWLNDLVLPEDRDLVHDALLRARAGENVSFEYRIKRPLDGVVRWMRDLDFAVRDTTGEVLWIGGIGRDISEEKHSAELMNILVAELQHRTRNLMGVVNAMFEKTLRASDDLSDFRSRFRDRLAALARVQGLLSRLNEADRVTFDELIRSELAAMGEATEKITLGGPNDVYLRSSTVQMLSMALHELATNAVKYGALAQSAGRLSVTWKLETREDAKPWLHIDWRESGVEMPPSGATARRKGQGRELIEHALPFQLKARTSYTLENDGVHCAMLIPISTSTSFGTAHG